MSAEGVCSPVVVVRLCQVVPCLSRGLSAACSLSSVECCWFAVCCSGIMAEHYTPAAWLLFSFPLARGAAGFVRMGPSLGQLLSLGPVFPSSFAQRCMLLPVAPSDCRRKRRSTLCLHGSAACAKVPLVGCGLELNQCQLWHLDGRVIAVFAAWLCVSSTTTGRLLLLASCLLVGSALLQRVAVSVAGLLSLVLSYACWSARGC